MEEIRDDGRDRRPRLSIDITVETQARLQKHLPWGLQSHVFRTMIEGLLQLLEAGGAAQRDLVVAAFLSRDITVLDLLRRVTNDEPK